MVNILAITLLVNIVLGGPSQYNRGRSKNIRPYYVIKTEFKMSLFTDNMIMYMENLIKNYHKNARASPATQW